MPNVIAPTVVVVFEHELIAAAKSLAPFAGGKKVTPDEMANALRCCYAAIYSPELASGEVPVTIMACRETVSISKTEVVSSNVGLPKP